MKFVLSILERARVQKTVRNSDSKFVPTYQQVSAHAKSKRSCRAFSHSFWIFRKPIFRFAASIFGEHMSWKVGSVPGGPQLWDKIANGGRELEVNSIISSVSVLSSLIVAEQLLMMKWDAVDWSREP